MSDIIEKIAAGEVTLLGIDDISKRLGVSRATFERWVRNGGKNRASTAFSLDEDSNIRFPPPDIRIGNSPRWDIETLKKWLRNNNASGEIVPQ